jgi:hypothetical protein
MLPWSVDPTRLNGVALTNWYRRSPAEIERERQAAEMQKYNAFFDQLRPTRRPLSHDEDTSPIQPDTPRPWSFGASGNSAQTQRHPSQADDVGASGSLRLAAISSPQTRRAQLAQPTGGAGMCTSCHGSHPEIPRPFPFPPALPFLFFRDVPPSTPPASPNQHPKQCAVQNAADARICNSLSSPRVRAKCFASATAREGYCIKSQGEVGWPELVTTE